jgi:hypothetical protein
MKSKYAAKRGRFKEKFGSFKENLQDHQTGLRPVVNKAHGLKFTDLISTPAKEAHFSGFFGRNTFKD